MVNSIAAGTGVSDRAPDRRQDRRGEGGSGASSPAAETVQTGTGAGSDIGLVIERDSQGAYQTYRLINRATGAVIAERPCEEVANLAKAELYTAGSVVRTRA